LGKTPLASAIRFALTRMKRMRLGSDVRAKYETAQLKANIIAWRVLIFSPPSLFIGTQINLVKLSHSENAQGWIVPQASWRTFRPLDGRIFLSLVNIER
jgi:hypothetical protein